MTEKKPTYIVAVEMTEEPAGANDTDFVEIYGREFRITELGDDEPTKEVLARNKPEHGVIVITEDRIIEDIVQQIASRVKKTNGAETSKK